MTALKYKHLNKIVLDSSLIVGNTKEASLAALDRYDDLQPLLLPEKGRLALAASEHQGKEDIQEVAVAGGAHYYSVLGAKISSRPNYSCDHPHHPLPPRHLASAPGRSSLQVTLRSALTWGRDERRKSACPYLLGFRLFGSATTLNLGSTSSLTGFSFSLSGRGVAETVFDFTVEVAVMPVAALSPVSPMSWIPA